jgi:hypothetical protein
MNDNLLNAIDLSIKLIEGKKVPEKEIPELNSRDRIISMYQTYKKLLFFMESLVSNYEVKEVID